MLGLLLLACAPKADVALESAVLMLPRNMWSTKPLPCGYREVALVTWEDWTYDDVLAQATTWIGKGNADAIIDYEVSKRPVVVGLEQCEEIKGCYESANSYVTGEATIWTVTGMAVDWVPGCPLLE